VLARLNLVVALMPLAIAIVSLALSSMAAGGPCPPEGSGGC
jgi:hypothetical protein